VERIEEKRKAYFRLAWEDEKKSRGNSNFLLTNPF
jgi:hypothetical protein